MFLYAIKGADILEQREFDGLKEAKIRLTLDLQYQGVSHDNDHIAPGYHGHLL
jgi:hypothetical protein